MFWSIMSILLTLLFGQKWSSYIEAFYFVSLLLPIILVTAYFFNNFLVPRYLGTRRYFRFTLYTLYTIVGSLYLTVFVVLFAFIYLANYSTAPLNPLVFDVLLMGFILYFGVFAYSFFILTRKNQSNQIALNELQQELSVHQNAKIEIRADRKNHSVNSDDIDFIESLGDYVKVHISDRELITKEKISHLENRLPRRFLRIHRSYIINRQKVKSFNREQVVLNNQELPISRTYKQSVLEKLGSGRPSNK